jgi:amino acid adenylation domain-containing protein
MAVTTEESRRALLTRKLRERAAGGIPAVPRESPLPLSFAQRRLWFLDQLGHTGSGYVIPLVASLEGPLDPAALQAALETVVRRHAVLRSRFFEQGDEVFQQEGPAYPVPLDCSEAVPAAAAAAAAVFTDVPFALDDGQLLRARLWRTGVEQHLLAVAVHHIAFDGWSIAVLGQELLALYGAALEKRPPTLPPLPIQYADFSVWQRDPIRLATVQARLATRAAQLAAMPAFRLRGNRRPPQGGPRQGRIHRFIFDQDLSDGLQAMAAAAGLTPFVVLLTGFMLLLCRRERVGHPVVGCPIAGRDGAEVEALLGFFVNSLVIGAELSPELSFLEALVRVQNAVADAMATQDIPFELLVEHAQPDRAFARNPMFEVMFAWQAPFRLPALSPELRFTALAAAETAARFDLECHAWRDDGRIQGGLIYDADRLDADEIADFATQFAQLLRSAVACPGAPAWQLPLGHPPIQFETISLRTESLAAVFARAVMRAPGATSIVHGESTLSYVQLDRRANALAARLRQDGIGPEVAVAMSLPRSIASIVAMVAVAKAGGALLAMDPAWPVARQQAAMTAAGARILLDDAAQAEAERPDAPALAGVGPHGLAYFAFTSGSTGQPKCIAVPEAAVVNLVLGTDYVSIGAHDRVAHLASPAFDAAVFEVWGALLNGAAVVVVDRPATLAPQNLAAALQQGGATIAFVTTALLHRMAEDVPDGFAGLRTLLFGGEACDPALVRRILAAGSPGRLLHVYGPTETTTFAAWHCVTAVPVGSLAVPIGQAVKGTRLHVVESIGRDEEAAPGVPGELLIGGHGVARGYHGAGGATADRFRPDPRGAPGSRLYRTGDLVRRRLDGALEFLGRIDRQVKIRGFRVEPAELEAVLRQHPGVVDAVVTVQPGPTGDRLVGYIVPHAAVAWDEAALHAHLAGQLPDWMLPGALHRVPALPLSSAGKIDQAALAASVMPEATVPTRPLSATEATVAGLYAELLDVISGAPDDDFFELGGHSLLASRLVARLRERTGMNLPLDAVFRSPSVAGLAAELDTLQDAFEEGEI